MAEVSRKQKEKRKKRLAVFIFIIITAIIVAAAMVWLITHNRDNQKISYRSESVNSTETAAAEESDIIEKQNDPAEKEKTDPEYVYNDHLSNFLFLGIDGRGTVDSIQDMWDIGSSDTIVLVSYDRAEETIKELVIPRDTMAEIETFNPMGRSLGLTIDHLNIQYSYGDGKLRSCEITKDAVSKILGTGIPIQGYCSLRMDGIPLLADVLGGIEVTVPDDTMADEEEGYRKGDVITLTTESAERFLRYRDIGISQSAIDRQNRQKAFMEGFIKKAKAEAEKDSGLVTRFYEALEPYLVTNMGNDLFAKLLTAENLGSETMPGEGIEGALHDEFYIDPDASEELLMEMFFK